MFYLRLGAALLGFLAASTYGVGIALLRRDRSRVAVDYARLLARLTQRPLGITRLEVHGEENLARERPCIYIANHQSNFDTPVLAPIYPEGTVVIAKKEIRKIPFFGWLFVATGNILIDRADRAQAVGRLKVVEDAIRERGVSVWIFPEGTRSKQPGRLLPFKKGAFQMAIGAGVPLVPVVVSPIRTIIDSARRRISPAPVEVRVLEPISTTGLTEADLDSLMDTAWSRMASVLQELTARHGAPALQPGGGAGA